MKLSNPYKSFKNFHSASTQATQLAQRDNRDQMGRQFDSFAWLAFQRLLCVICLASSIATDAVAEPANVEKTPDGLLIRLRQAQVELAAVNSNTLRLSVSLDGTPRPATSTFLADTNENNLVAWNKISRDGMVGVQTIAGKLLMNPENGEWTLENADGKTLVPIHAIGDLQQSSNSCLNIALGWEKNQPISVYGCGNKVNSLLQSNVKTHVGNGLVVVPYFWSATGYAVLAVTSDDNRPARWQAATNDQAVTWIFPGRTADLYFMPSATLKDAAKDCAQLTGHAPVPPLWTFGYLQSRWGWTNRAYIEDTLKKFANLKIPVDAFIFDFEWFTKRPDYTVPNRGVANYNDFGWNTNLFPQPAEQIKTYKKEGVHIVGIRKPRLGNAEDLKMIHERSWNLQNPDESGYHARDLSFDIPGLRNWYVEQSAGLLKAGIDGWWNDEGESKFTLYYYWNLAEQEALQKYRPGLRLWTLNRAYSPGLQRLGAAVWTGDIRASWEVFASTPTALLNLTLAGMPYETCDIGGFFGTPTPELLSRWTEAGVFFPFIRTHSIDSVKPHFPWLFGDDALNAIRKAIELRYRLIPYYYSLAHETFKTGVPLMRPLVMEFPNDPKVANMSDEWMIGASLLAAPILQPGDERSVYLPPDEWYAFESNVPLKGNQTTNVMAKLDEIPFYVRAGTILPLAPIVQHTSELPGGPLELEIYPGKDTTFTLFEDDGETTDYLKGQVRRTTFTWRDATGELTWTRKGNYKGKNVFRDLHVVVFGRSGTTRKKCPLDSSGSLVLNVSESHNKADIPATPTADEQRIETPPQVRGEYFSKKKYAPEPLPTFDQVKDKLPDPVLPSRPEWIKMYWKSWQLAFAHFEQPSTNSPLVSNWLDASFNKNIFQWDTAFMMMFARYGHYEFPAIQSLDNFYCLQRHSGYICREYSHQGEEMHFGSNGGFKDPEGWQNTVNPPLFAWAEWQYFKISGDKSRLAAVLPALEKYAQWLEQDGSPLDLDMDHSGRHSGGTPHDLYWNTPLGSGMDDSPMPRGPSCGYVDMSCQMVMMYESLANIYRELGQPDKAKPTLAKAEAIKKRINQWCWDETDGFYYDVDAKGVKYKVKIIAGFWPLIAGVASPEQVQRLVAHLKNEKEFWRPFVFPTVAADEKEYNYPTGHYARGAIMHPINYMIIKGLETCGQEEFATVATEKFLEDMSDVYQKKGTIFENYMPEKIEPDTGRRDFVGWGGLGPISLLIENVMGFHPDAANNTLRWDLRLMEPFGINRLRFGDVTTDIAYEGEGKITVKASAPYTLIVNGTKLSVSAGNNEFASFVPAAR